MTNQRVWCAMVAIFVAAVSAAYGVALHKYQLFPYGQLAGLIGNIRCSMYGRCAAGLPLREVQAPDTEGLRSLFRNISLRPWLLRKELRDKLIIRSCTLKVRKAGQVSHLEGITRLLEPSARVVVAKTYGVIHYGILERTSKKTVRGLLIYHQGHGGNPFDFDYFYVIRKKVFEAGFDLLSLSMTGLGYNAVDNSFPSRQGEMFIPKQNDAHIVYSLFHDPSKPEYAAVAIMLSGNFCIIDKISKNYSRTMMVGISGGGWYTTVLSALLPRVDASISFAGTVPLYLRGSVNNSGDWEQTAASIWQEYDYWHFYFLAAVRERGGRRTHIQAYNDEDPCCFQGASGREMVRMSEALQLSGFRAVMIKNDRHSPDMRTISDELRRLVTDSQMGNPRWKF